MGGDAVASYPSRCDAPECALRLPPAATARTPARGTARTPAICLVRLKPTGSGADDANVKPSFLSHARLTWLVTTAILAVVTLMTVFGPLSDVRWEYPKLLFSLVVVSAAACIVGATIVAAIADRRELAEIGLFGATLMGASVMPLVRGLVTPGVLYDETSAYRTAAFLSLPVAIAIGAPLLRPHSPFGSWAARHWRDWTLVSLLGVFVLASLVAFFPDAVAASGPRAPFTVAVVVAVLLALASMSLRQLRLFEIAQHPANMVASISLVLLAVSALLPMSNDNYSPGFWWLHVAGSVGVIGACVGMIAAKRMSPIAHDVLAPVLARDPLAAFELGLSPIVDQFITSIDERDALGRDHVIRTAELAVRIGERFRLPARSLRDLGLAAMLHDVGKINVPTEILTKSGPLSDQEFDVIKRHAVDGERMLIAEPTLASCAPYVRSHHERMDGQGYPDGLAGIAIPLPSRIIAVCDAFDAMTNDRQYRKGMPVGMAIAVLRELAGRQWDPAVIDQLIAVLPSMPSIASLDEHGRDSASTDPHTMPDDISELMQAVDAEI